MHRFEMPGGANNAGLYRSKLCGPLNGQMESASQLTCFRAVLAFDRKAVTRHLGPKQSD